MNKNTFIILIVVLAVGLGLVMYHARTNPVSVSVPVAVQTTPVTATNLNDLAYDNTKYGFTFDLPPTWQGYTIEETTWTGTPIKAGGMVTGPKLLIRNPNWSKATPYEDLPVLVFTLAEWNSYVAENFTISAAPIQASELGRNNAYVFALPPRWDFDYSKGFEEAEAIIAAKPLHPTNVAATGAPQAKLNIELVCKKATETMRFKDAASLDAYVSDCIAGKHPEVIEKYKADMNLGAGVAI